MKRLAFIVVVAALFALPPPASADLIPATGFMVNGTGEGAVATLVTMNAVQGADWEAGCTTGNANGKGGPGTGCVGFPEGDFGQYVGQNNLFPLVDLVGAAGNAGQLALIFNPNETGNEVGGPSLNLLSISLGIYSSTGTLLEVFTFAPDNGLILKSAGVGSSGFYQFDLVNGEGSNYLASGGYLIGGAFSANLVNDGPETVYAIKQNTTTPVPEPASLLLLGMGLVGLGRVARRRR